MDRASDFGSDGWGFESLRAHLFHKGLVTPDTFGTLPWGNEGGNSLRHIK